MPAEGTLDGETRDPIFSPLGVRASSKACVRVMANKANVEGTASDKMLPNSAHRPSRAGDEVLGDAEPVFEARQGKSNKDNEAPQ